MKILVIVNVFHPDRGGGASVFSDLCFGLAAKGHEVDVLTAYPYYPEWKNKSDASLWRVGKETMNGVNVTRYGLFIPSKPSSLLQRMFYEFSFTLSLLRSLPRTKRYDMTMIYCPLIGAVLFAVIRKWIVGGRLWLNVQDIPADAASAAGISKNRLFDRFATKFQSFLFRQATDVSTISPVMVKRVGAIIGRGTEPLYFPNWLNESMETWINKLKPGNSGAAKSGVPVLLYAGNIGKKQGLLECCKQLASTDLRFEFRVHGDGAEAGNLKDWIQERGDPRFIMGEFLPEEGFVKALYAADYFLITETASVGASFIPSKLIPCIATGTPIIAICEQEGPLGSEVLEHNLGAVLKWSDLDKIASLITSDALNSAGYKEQQLACLDRSQVYRRATALRAVETVVGADGLLRRPATEPAQ